MKEQHFKELLFCADWYDFEGPLISHYEQDGKDHILWCLNPERTLWVLMGLPDGVAKGLLDNKLTCYEVFVVADSWLLIRGAHPIMNPESVEEVEFDQLPAEALPKIGVYLSME